MAHVMKTADQAQAVAVAVVGTMAAVVVQEVAVMAAVVVVAVDRLSIQRAYSLCILLRVARAPRTPPTLIIQAAQGWVALRACHLAGTEQQEIRGLSFYIIRGRLYA